MQAQVFGDYKESAVRNPDCFAIEINCENVTLHWNQCHQLADFLSAYFACFFTDRETRNDMTHSISYVLNELTENAIKFRSKGDVLISSSIGPEEIGFMICNQIAASSVPAFQAILTEITSRDPGELLIERIEQNALNSGSKASGLGFLTIMNDYGVKLGWTFEDGDDKEHVALKTMARLVIRKDN